MPGTSVVVRILSDGEARFVKSLLESYGIPVTISSPSGLPHRVYPLTFGEVSVEVPEEFRDEALRIIETTLTDPHWWGGDTGESSEQ